VHDSQALDALLDERDKGQEFYADSAYTGKNADSENRIKELRQDFGLNSFSLDDFYATEAALTVAMTAYNVMAIFQMFILKSEVQYTLSTLRFRTFVIGAYFQKIKGKTVLSIALAIQRRKWFE
jgi:hypothetical protein